MMYELNEKWKLYYSETDPAKRRELFDAATADNAEEDAATLRKSLYECRYTGDGADMMIRLIMGSISAAQVVRFALKWNVKSIKKDMERAGFKTGFDAGDTGRECLFHEIKNGVKRYIETCRSDSYGSAFSGMIKISRDEQHGRMTKELYNMTYGLMEKSAGIEVERFREYMLLFSEATEEAYQEEFQKPLGRSTV